MKAKPIGIGGITLLAILAFVIFTLMQPRDPASPSTDQMMKEAEATVRIERLVKNRLRDPESATFKHLGGGCGYVNSRNGFGGMSGDVQFIVGANDKAVFRPDNPSAFATVWREHCVNGLTP